MASNLIHDFNCSPCKDDGLNNEAKFVCKECRKYYCDNCVLHHNKLFRTHTVLGREDVSKWVGYAGLNPIEMCDKHGDKKLKLLCEDHDELACNICVSLTHRMCKRIKYIPELANRLKEQTDFRMMPIEVEEISERLKEISDERTEKKHSNEEGGKMILAEIRLLRKKVNDHLDELEKHTIDILHAQLKEIDDFLQGDINSCTQYKKVLDYHKELTRSQQNDSATYIAYKKCKDTMKEANRLLQTLSVKPYSGLTFEADTRIEKLLSGIQTLGTTSSDDQFRSPCYIPPAYGVYASRGNVCNPYVT